jgi:hypothetical protein
MRMTINEAGHDLLAIATQLIHIDGDRDHMNKSDLKVEQTLAIAARCKEIGYALLTKEI